MPEGDVDALRDRYLSLLERSLCGVVDDDAGFDPVDGTAAFRAELREHGRDWPLTAASMIGTRRMRNLRELTESVVRRAVPGDLIETGVWRGGATIMMRAVLAAYGVTDRAVWAADSFRGLPPPNAARYPQDAGLDWSDIPQLAVSEDDVRERFRRYGLLDDQVRFVSGWFSETLAHIPAPRFALVRLDGDLYESTIDALTHLYPKLSPGGYAIVDDYAAIPACAAAVDDYRAANDIAEPIVRIDWTGVFWQKT